MTHARHCLSLTLKRWCLSCASSVEMTTQSQVLGRRVFSWADRCGVMRGTPTPANIKFMITEEKRWSVDATLEGKFCVKAPVRLADDDDEVCQTLPVDTVTAPDAAFGGPRLGCANLGHTGAHPTGSNTCKSIMHYTSYLRTKDCTNNGYVMNMLEHNTMINIDTGVHMISHNTQT